MSKSTYHADGFTVLQILLIHQLLLKIGRINVLKYKPDYLGTVDSD